MSEAAPLPPASRIVVGVDGSPDSIAALRWALVEAEQRNAQLDVVHVWPFPASPPPEAQALFARRVAAELAGFLGGRRASVPVRVSVVPGPTGAALAGAARGAEMLVVGASGRNPVGEFLLGSSGQHAAGSATCPVVLVPARVRAQARTARPRRRARGR